MKNKKREIFVIKNRVICVLQFQQKLIQRFKPKTLKFNIIIKNIS